MREKNHVFMKTSTAFRSIKHTSASWFTALAVALTAIGALTAAAASAQTEPSFCTGDVVVDGGGVTLRNVEGWRSVGPFEVDIDAGWYVVVALSKTVGDDAELDTQQWTVESADGSWQSALTLDVPAGEDLSLIHI